MLPDLAAPLERGIVPTGPYKGAEVVHVRSVDGTLIYIAVKHPRGVMINSIQDATSGIGPSGTRINAIDAPNWTTPLLDHTDQILGRKEKSSLKGYSWNLDHGNDLTRYFAEHWDEIGPAPPIAVGAQTPRVVQQTAGGARPFTGPSATSAPLAPWYDITLQQGFRTPLFVALGNNFASSQPYLPVLQPAQMTMQNLQWVMGPDGNLVLEPAPEQQVTLLPFDFDSTSFPGPDQAFDSGFDWSYSKGITDGNGRVTFNDVPMYAIDLPPAPISEIWGQANYAPTLQPAVSGAGWQSSFVSGPTGSIIIVGDGLDPEVGALPGLNTWLDDGFNIGNRNFQVYLYPSALSGVFDQALQGLPGNLFWEPNSCIDAAAPQDAYFHSRGSWGQDYDDQWAVKAVGLTADSESGWAKGGETRTATVVAIIDTGLDWHHPDLDWKNIWRNEDEIPENGIDDDGNGYVDDIIGWDFMEKDNKPWDYDGHGTMVTGIIAAAHNGEGIAGVDPNVKIMVLKGVNNLKQSRASYIAKAMVYAVDNGARVINLSLSGEHPTKTLGMAVEYAHSKGVMVVVAAGNAGAEVKNFAPAAYPGVLTVAAVGSDGARAGSSNWGPQVDIAAPGVDILSLRARGTDLMNAMPGITYQPRNNYVGPMRRYYRATGTSFSAAIVTGIASLVLSQRPELTAAQVKRILLQSAQDIEIPGFDQYTGYGLLDARAALSADPKFFVDALITSVKVVKTGMRPFVRVTGTADADQLKKAWVEIGAGEKPTEWKKVSWALSSSVRGAKLADIPTYLFAGSNRWTIRVITEHQNGRRREARSQLSFGSVTSRKDQPRLKRAAVAQP